MTTRLLITTTKTNKRCGCVQYQGYATDEFCQKLQRCFSRLRQISSDWEMNFELSSATLTGTFHSAKKKVGKTFADTKGDFLEVKATCGRQIVGALGGVSPLKLLIRFKEATELSQAP